MKIRILYILIIILTGITKPATTKAQNTDHNYIITKTMLHDEGGNYLENIQYYDGMGRPTQSVFRNLSPGKQDIVSQQDYDGFGRKDKAWIATPVARNDGNFVENLPDVAISYHLDDNPYAKALYEKSPLSRATNIMEAGKKWQSSEKGVLKEYLSNTVSGLLSADMYKLFSGGMIMKNNTYPANELYVEKTTDEDGNIQYSFVDKLGQLILHRQMNGDERIDTYYVYDNLGRLRYVLPPMINGDVKQANLNLYAYSYKYDEYGRCIEKKMPGCDPVYMVYDRRDHLVFTQDGEQRKENKWTFSIPDLFSRITVTGICQGTISNGTNISNNDIKNKIIEAVYTGDTDYGYIFKCDEETITLSQVRLLSVNYYDNYNFLNKLPAASKSILTYTEKSGYDTRYENTKGLLTGTRIYDLYHSTQFTVSAYYYDYKGNQVQVLSTNHMGGYDKNYYRLSFTGKVKKLMHEHYVTGQQVITQVYTYTYDHAERLLKTEYQLNGNTPVTLSENTYNELGLTKSKKIHNGKDVTNYSYNIRQWLTEISGDRFQQSLAYDTYNGNITSMIWRTMPKVSIADSYKFEYDGINRLKKAIYNKYPYGTSSILNNEYSVYIDEYDRHGNIKKLTRRGVIEKSAMSPGYRTGIIDDLTLEYHGNQLKRITDYAANDPVYKETMHFTDGTDQEEEYTYDSNGNLKSDLNRRIVFIKYNPLNLPSKIYLDTIYKIDYNYDAAGNKIKAKYLVNPKIYANPGGAITDSIGTGIGPSPIKPGGPGIPGIAPMAIGTIPGEDIPGIGFVPDLTYHAQTTIDYCGNIIYRNGKLDKILTPEGYIDKNKNGSFVYHYYLKDHQGNNRIVIDQDGTVEQVNHYYPFGALWGTSKESGSTQAFKFGDKELDRMYGLDLYDFLSRMLDPVLGRFTTMDPHAENYYSHSPYAYCGNDPINRTDPDGRDWYKDNRGNYLWTRSSSSTYMYDDVEYSRVGSSMSIPMIDGTYLNYYQNILVSNTSEPNKAFESILGSKKMQNMLMNSDELADEYKDRLLLGLINHEVNEVGKDIAVAAFTLMSIADGVALAEGGIGLASLGIRYIKTLLKGTSRVSFSSMMHISEATRYAKYWQNKAPSQVVPGTKRLDWYRVSGRTKQMEKSRVIYDDYGRQIYRVDFTDHMRPLDHSSPHLHEYIFGRGYSPKGKESLFNF